MNMLKDFLSEEKFKKGIIHYLKKFSYRNAKNDDLWSSLSNVSSLLSYSRLLLSLKSNWLIMKVYHSCIVRQQMFIPLATLTRLEGSTSLFALAPS